MLRRFRRRERRQDAGGGQGDLGRTLPAEDRRGPLRFEVTEGAGSARMALYGEFDIASADDAGRALQDLLGRGPAAVVIDLSGLDFMDSTGVKFLVDGRDTARARGVKLSLVDGADAVQRILTVSGVAALFEEVDGNPLT